MRSHPGELSPQRMSMMSGKVPSTALALHPVSLPRGVNDSLQAPIPGGGMTQIGLFR